MTEIKVSESFQMDAFGNYRDTKSILEFFIKETSSANTEYSKLNSYMKGNENVDMARDLMYSSIIPFKVFQGGTIMNTETIPASTIPCMAPPPRLRRTRALIKWL